MTPSKSPEIVIEGAKSNNLKDVSLRIPHNKLIVVTGVSGSGKSSLVFDLIAKEGQRRYFETLPSFARQFLGKLNRPDADLIEGLSPVISISQHATGRHARSTVGTMSDLYDLLRLLFARTGASEKDIALSRALFSFNSEVGKCPKCNGIGKEEDIDLNRLVTEPNKTIREGALAPTLPTGYIMYSQVTIDVLNQVCEAEGFNVDIPWNELTHQQRKVILYGSQKIKVPFGKHSLESRLKWTGIKAKPREEGYYKGMIPIMSDILRRDRNANILKYVHAITCSSCKGTRLNDDALRVKVHGKNIAEVAAFEISALIAWINAHRWNEIGTRITQKIKERAEVLLDLGLGHLTLNRTSQALRSSEMQRIRVANQILLPLSNVLYIFDEPSIGLHRDETHRMIRHLRQLVNKGNTVILVEHDLQTIRNADHIIEIGPGPGVLGGNILFNGPLLDFIKQDELARNSPTYRALQASAPSINTPSESDKSQPIKLIGCRSRNLKNIDVIFQPGKLNVVSGRSGTGKFSLIKETLIKLLEERFETQKSASTLVSGTENLDQIKQWVYVSHSPIGKTPRSNPATYLGISDHIRDLYAKLPDSKEKGFNKSRFSFNTKGGRCETCLGAGKTQIGMHFLGNVDQVCPTCTGDRFNTETLTVRYQGRSIAECYQLSVNEALTFFEGHSKVLTGLKILHEIGLGYLTLGQSSTTLSGGEAQRIKIANQLQKKDTGDTLYVIIEPAIGLHHDDIGSLLQFFDRIKQKGNTIICIEQNETIIQSSDWHLELGPEFGKNGGHLLHMGVPCQIAANSYKIKKADTLTRLSNEINLHGVTTHKLKQIDVRFPKNQMTVVTGVSGSGKSSLVYDTLFAEANARFSESLSAHNRSFLQLHNQAKIDSYEGLAPAIGLQRQKGSYTERSTVGTLSGIHDDFRLLYSRIAQLEGNSHTAQHFSFNHHLGACTTCEGLGTVLNCNPEELIINQNKSIFEGALSTNKALAYYADVNGQFMATLQTVAEDQQWNLNQTWNQLSEEQQRIILYGTGEKVWKVTWHFKTKTKSGTQHLTAKWLGLCNYIEDEYHRRLHNKNIEHLKALMYSVTCLTCHGSRLKPELLETQYLGNNIHELTQFSILECHALLVQEASNQEEMIHRISEVVIPGVLSSLKTMLDLGLGHLNLHRPINTLSGGERQRVTLAGQLSNHLYGITYVLDEPTIGLDRMQVEELTKVLNRLITNGNTVVVVEHDPDFIRSADHVIELGPGAGQQGGEVIFQGGIADINQSKSSATYQLLQGKQVSAIEPSPNSSLSFGIKGANSNNLKDIHVDFNSGQVTAVTGVSGSGKSSLIKEVLYASWRKQRPVNCPAVYGLEQFKEVVLIDQEPVAQNRFSTPVTYLGILEEIKRLFAQSDQSKAKKLNKADFSYLSKRGKCPTCAGAGQIKTSMDFMSDLWLTCDTCQGKRYQQEILEIKHKGMSIGEVLDLPASDAIAYFEGEPITEGLHLLATLGIGHLKLGQALHTLSGGELQRLKLAKSLLEKRQGNTLYLFDEPSTGLHYFDLLRLIQVFQYIINEGNTLIFIEHNQTLIQSANQVITLGPGSGDSGGSIISSELN